MKARKASVVDIRGRKLGPGHDVFVIAEIGINHNQDIDLAYGLIDAAAAAGCDAAKFQTFRAKDLYIHRSLAGTYRLMGRDIPIYDLHTGLEMSTEWIRLLQTRCRRRGIIFFSTPVARPGVDALDRAGVPAFKISSYDLTNIPLIRYVASKRKPVIFSTGGARLAEVEETARGLREAGVPFAMMQCIAKYPAPYRCANLAVMDTLRSAFRVPVGFSDNGFVDGRGRIDGLRVPLAAAQAGADLFEVHITLDRGLPGADHGFATLPDELKTMVSRMRAARRAYNAGRRIAVDPELMGTSVKDCLPEEAYVRDFAYKCLFTVKPLRRGERFASGNVGVLRPGQYRRRGLAPRYYDLVVRRARASRNMKAWQPITWEEILHR